MDRNKTIALLANNLTNGFNNQIIWSIQTECFSNDYDAMIYCVFAARDFGGHSYLFDKIISEKKVGALIGISTPIDNDVADRIIKAGIGLVSIEGDVRDSFKVLVDNKKGAYDAVCHLIERGRKRIGIVMGSPQATSSQRERLSGYKAALLENNMEISENLIWESTLYSYKTGKDAFRYMIMNDADGIFCASGDYVAHGIMGEAKRQGISIPGQVSLVGYDDIELSKDLEITTVRQPLNEMGREAFKFACDSIKDPRAKPKQKLFIPELIIRESS